MSLATSAAMSSGAYMYISTSSLYIEQNIRDHRAPCQVDFVSVFASDEG